jgi:hypothetical protein
VNPNLRVKSYVSRVLLHLLILLLLFTFSLSISCIRSSLLSLFLVVLILTTVVICALSLVDYLILQFIILPYSSLHKLAWFLVQIVMSSFLYSRLLSGHCSVQPDKV